MAKPNSAKPYALLRTKMAEMGVDREYLARAAKRSVSYLETRLSGRKAWDQDDMFAIMDLLYISHDETHIYFPPKGDKSNLRYAHQPKPRRKAPPQEPPVFLMRPVHLTAEQVEQYFGAATQ